ncbi:MAG TPA: hypothetical protein PKE69_25270 [Pyrinomonadaceae bacterium]|nr:hypothetical protein [Pyrinomonadaceae bacterium]
MEQINVPKSVKEQLLRNAEDYALAMMMIATPEQIVIMQKQNELFDRGLEICPNCGQESSLESKFCESCRESKIPF